MTKKTVTPPKAVAEQPEGVSSQTDLPEKTRVDAVGAEEHYPPLGEVIARDVAHRDALLASLDDLPSVDEVARRFPRVAILTANGVDLPVPDGSLIITCSVPGFRRAGAEHPSFRIHPSDRFTEEQLKLLRDEPKLTVIRVG